jgi:tetratricopeptide (TPR) repeat protein
VLAALGEFALGQRGPDQIRLEAAQLATRAGVLPVGLTRMWIRGAWTEVLLIGFEVSDEPVKQHPPRVEQWAREATLALRAGDAHTAEQLLNQALAVEPDAPDLLNNLAMAYQLQGRTEDGVELVQQIHTRFPDYLFARVSVARLHVQRGETKRAYRLLEPLLQRRELHTSEFTALCAVFIDLHLADHKVEGARSWLSFWETAEPDDPQLGEYRRRLAASSVATAISQRLFGKRSRRTK